MKPTHTHCAHGGRYVEVSQHAGTGALEGQKVVVYHDLGRDVMSATTLDDWRQHWRPLDTDDCPICLGAGHDQIKGNKTKPCGGCYGLGKVQGDGQTPGDRWQLAEVAIGIITALRNELSLAKRQLEGIHAVPGVNEALEAHLQDAVARQEQEWRDGQGHGPGGRRHTGD
ncbi:MAG: hypothetical protein ACQEUG_15795 [Pseudomonadota bacterium]